MEPKLRPRPGRSAEEVATQGTRCPVAASVKRGQHPTSVRIPTAPKGRDMSNCPGPVVQLPIGFGYVNGEPRTLISLESGRRGILSRFNPGPTQSYGLGDLLRTRLLHGTHIEIEHTLSLVALFLVLLPKLDDFFENLY